MKVSSKMLILWIGIITAITAVCSSNIATAIVSAGSFIAFAILEVQEMKLLNTNTEEE